MNPTLGPIAGAVEQARTDLASTRAVERLARRDHTLWPGGPVEVADRLGWLDEADRMRARLAELAAFAAAARADGLRRVLWCGMGGSSLFAEVLAAALPGEGATLRVLDTSHPGAVARAADEHDPDETLFCFASKSGGTIETRCHLDYFWDRVGDGARFAAVTDAGSSLDGFAGAHAFRACFHAHPEIGGRYSALSHFGMVPAALLGSDAAALLDRAADMARRAGAPDGPGAALAAVLAGAARAGRTACTLVVPTALGPFGAWLEQLVAESTGKHGVGILPVTGERLGAPEVYGDDRLFVAYPEPEGAAGAAALDALAAAGHPVVRLDPAGPLDLGAEALRWETAVALAGALLGINPFDQPDVEAAKQATARVLAGGAPPVPRGDARGALAGAAAGPGRYVAIQAFVDPAGDTAARLAGVAERLRDRLRVPVTVGLGPRYLHSTGQLHKGGPPRGVFLQVVERGDADLAVPGRDHTFGQLLAAQADGDWLALRDRGLAVERVESGDLLDLA